MVSFQKIVIISALVLLVILLLIVIYTVKTAKDKQWPPVVPECPDYWDIKLIDGKQTCVNTKDLGTCPAVSDDKHLKMNFNTLPFTGTRDLCSKYKWATHCNVTWDGITYGYENPCITTA